MTAGDAVVLALLLVAGAGGLVTGVWRMSPGEMVVVEVNSIAVQTLSLRRPSRTSVAGVRGELIVEVRDGRAAVVSAECPNHVCVRTGWRSRAGDVIVCVPNRVIVRIMGKHQEGVRAITG
jgi:hypothetical protein